MQGPHDESIDALITRTGNERRDSFSFARRSSQPTTMRLVHCQVLLFAHAPKCAAADTLAVRVQARARARDAEVAQIVLRLSRR